MAGRSKRRPANKNMMHRKILLFISIVCSTVAQEKESRVLQELVNRNKNITQAARLVGISPRLVAAVIYAERLRNVHWDDTILDEVLARNGYNSSVGFAQIKVNTAFWIEEQLHTPEGTYFLGKQIQSLFSRSRSREALVKKLTVDSLNIHYCAVYLAMIKKRWNEAGYFFTPFNETGLLATLFSLGIVKLSGEERLPHANAAMNKFGETAQRFYNGFQLREEFGE